MDRISFAGQVAVVTGAGRALGRSYAKELAHRGAAVVVNDVGGQSEADGPWAEIVAQEIITDGGRAVAAVCSVMDPAGGAAIIDAALSHFGKVDVVINNAGFLRSAMFEDLTESQIRETVDVHLLAAFHVTRPAWPIMMKNGYGRVIFTSSGSAFGNEGNSNYVAAKTGLLGLAAALALEGRHHGIGVNCIMPYAVSMINRENRIVGQDSPRNRAGLEAMTDRRGPDSVTPLVAYLASSTCTASGQAFSALAGRYARVALLLADGWLGDPATATAEDVAAHFDEISDLSHGSAPASMTEEIEGVLARLGRDATR